MNQGSKASEGLGIKNDKFSRRMRRSLVQNLVPGATKIFVVRSYLNWDFYSGTTKENTALTNKSETLTGYFFLT
jgi:hypothetical protein